MDDVYKHIITYLKQKSNIYIESCKFAPSITIALPGHSNSPSRKIESSLFFFPDAIEIRVYYACPGPQIVSNNLEQLPSLYRLLNYLNACVFVKNMDGVGNEFYRPSYLLQPRFYLTEDGQYDITATVILEKDFFGLAPLEIEDFITIALPALMNALSPYIFGVVTGKLAVEAAIRQIQRNILSDSEEHSWGGA